jgi:TetR/AcrR family transcriptional repressor of mexJK operon
MKEWAPDHPKAKLMARKRAAILAAAKAAFLTQGYEGTSMEAIAAAADVSVMTLYRHARSKDELFAAVIANASSPDDEAENARYAALIKKPLAEILVIVGLNVQRRLTDPETVALMRVVVAETARFPKLADMAYRGLIGNMENVVQRILAAKEESLHAADLKKLSGMFIDRFCGADMLRILLGLKGLSQAEQKQRAERARDEVMAAIGR